MNALHSTSCRSYRIVWVDLSVGYILLFLSGAFLRLLPTGSLPCQVAVVLIFSIWLGLVLHYISLFLHAGGHSELASDRETNDCLANVFFGSLLLNDIRVYRKIHFKHHRLLHTPDDPEDHYMNPIGLKSFAKYFLLIETMNRLYAKYTSLSSNSNELPTNAFWQLHYILLGFMLWQGLFGSYFLFCGGLSGLGAWLLGFFCWLPVFTWLRTYCEHSKLIDGLDTRDFGLSFLGFFLGAAGFRKHAEHHDDPSASYVTLRHSRTFPPLTTYESVVLSAIVQAARSSRVH